MSADGKASGTGPVTPLCAEMRERLPRFADGVLAPEEARRTEEHLAGCPACTAELRAWRAEQKLLSEALAGLKPSESFRGRVSLACAVHRQAERVAHAMPERGWRYFRWGLACAALVYLAVLYRTCGGRELTPEDEMLRRTFSPLFTANILTLAVAFLLLLAGGRVAHLECYLSGRFGGQAVRKPTRLEVVALEMLGVLGVLATGLFAYLFLAR